MVINFNTALVQGSLTGGFIEGTTTDTGQTITKQSVDPVTSNSDSFQSSLSIFSNILQGGELPETFRESVFSSNQIAIGESIIDRANESQALADSINQQIEIRESQRIEDLGFLQAVDDRLSGQITDLGGSISDVSNSAGSDGGFFGGFKLPTLNDIKTPLLLAGLALGALIILPRIIKSGFK